MKKMLLWIFLVTIALSAAFVPIERAKTVAENQFKQYCADTAAKSAVVANVIEHVYDGEITWYAVEFEQGFVIVSADDAVRPILGYSDHGRVAPEDRFGGQNFKEWFGNYDKQIAYVRKNNIVDEVGRQSWKNIENNVFSSSKANVIVDRLLRSEWDQSWPWNDQCPMDGNVQTPVGCVATAMAQVTRYHQWPDVGEGSNGADFTTHTWDYDLMPYIVDFNYGIYPEPWDNGLTQEQVDELATQSYWMGLSVNMNYSADGSAATMAAMATALNNNWKAQSSVRSSFSTPSAGGTDLSYSAIKAELDANRPWLWAGGVHAFVLDGYRDDYWYHFNWGWGGSYDGWFHRSTLIPDGTGTGGGDGDYSAGQEGVTYVPSTDTFATWPAASINGSVSDGEDVTLTWSAESGATGYKIYRTKNTEGVPTLIGTTTSTSFGDNNLSLGNYAYHVIVTYATGESHNSNTYYCVIEVVSDYKPPTGVKATTVGRTAIDLEWVKPYTGLPMIVQGWESGSLDTWTLRSSDVFTGGSGWTADDGTRWDVADEVGGVDPEYIHDGDWTNYIGYDAGNGTGYEMSWIISPEITIGDNDELDFWVWYCNNSPEGSGEWPTDMWFVFYEGNFSESSGSAILANTTVLDEWDGEVLLANDPVNWGNNKFEAPVHFDLTAYGITGHTGYLGFIYEYNDGYQAAIDDVVYGSTVGGSTEPDGYEVYRNGSSATIISGATNLTWSDTEFADGENSYYVRALYPSSNISIPSDTEVAFIDANPKPYYLTGIYDGGTGEIDLTWFQPYMNPTMWYCYYDVNNSTTTIDMLTDPAPQRRVEFASDAGYYYPVTIDSIGAYFYEWADDPWSTDKFDIRIVAMGFYAPGGGFLPDTTLWEATNQTAVAGEFFKIALPTPMVRTKGWAVEVYAAGSTTGHPGNLAGPSPDGDVHSFFYETTEDSYSYYMVTGGEPAEYAILTHIESAEAPVIAKDGWASASNLTRPTTIPGYKVENVVKERFPVYDKRDKIITEPIKGAKALDTYYVYRNSSYLGESNILSYTDTNPAAGDNTYYVTAVYTSPDGESAPSNEVTIGPPPVISVPATITEAVAPDASSVRTFNIENTGIGTLDYAITYEYVEQMTEEANAIDNTFDTDLDGYTAESDWVWNNGAAYIVDGGVADLAGSVTSPEFDGTGCTTFEFDHVSNLQFKNANGSDLWVEYTLDGSNWIEVYSQSAATNISGHLSYNLPSVSTTMKVRFRVDISRRTNSSVSIDNVKVFGDELVLIDPWFSLTSPSNGTVLAGENFDFECTYDAAGKLEGSAYHVNVTITSNDESNPIVVIPVTFNVETGGAPVVPAVPANVVTSIVAGDLVIDWDDSADATGYAVYSSDDPYGTFTLVTGVTPSTYTIAADQAKLFYYIIATNGTKTALKTIKVKKLIKSAR